MDFAALYVGYGRARAKFFSLLVGRSFKSFGPASVIVPPLRLAGQRAIVIGRGVYIGSDSWLQAIDPETNATAITIGDGTSMSGHCVVSSARSISIGKKVLFARNVYVSDHIHAYLDTHQAVLDQGLDRIDPVEIGDGAWLGQNVVVCPGVTIGPGAVVGANAVVVDDIPGYCVAVGAPARVVKRFGSQSERDASAPSHLVEQLG